MINKDSIVTAYDEHLTLVEWLQKVETALNNAVLTNLGIAKLSDKDNVATYQVTAAFADNTTIVSNAFTLPSTDIVTAFNNLTTLVNGFDNRITNNTADIDNVKSSVNTGTFNPTSDNPAGQASLSAILSDIELKARYASMLASGKGEYAFYNMSDNVITTKTTTRGTGAYSLLGTYGGDCLRMFASNNVLTEIADYSTGLKFADIFNRATSLKEAFRWCTKLVRIGTRENPYNVIYCTNLDSAFSDAPSLKEIHMKNISVSFDISSSTKFEESDLVEILNNLSDLTGKQSQTLTMGATNLAKLTDAEKAIATSKNWVLA